MKEKIKSALKDKYKNMDFGDKAIDSAAEYLSGSIKEESLWIAFKLFNFDLLKQHPEHELAAIQVVNCFQTI